MAAGEIIFVSIPGEPYPGIISRGEIKSGRFKLSTYVESDGVLPGRYVVYIADSFQAAEDRHMNDEEPDFHVEVTRPGRNHFIFRLKP